MKKWVVLIGLIVALAIGGYSLAKITTSTTTITGDGAITIASGGGGDITDNPSSGFWKLTPTWNNSGTVFTGLRENVTNTASAAGSLLLDLQLGGTSKFNVDTNGKFGITPSSNVACATNYTRVGTNGCILTTTIATSFTIATTCTSITANTSWSVPSTAKVLRFVLAASHTSGTVAGEISTTVAFYSDSLCTALIGGDTLVSSPVFGAYSGDTTSGHSVESRAIPYNVFINGAATIYAKKADSLTNCTGCSSAMSVTVAGYSE